jgi:hypothetical protein
MSAASLNKASTEQQIPVVQLLKVEQRGSVADDTTSLTPPTEAPIETTTSAAPIPPPEDSEVRLLREVFSVGVIETQAKKTCLSVDRSTSIDVASNEHMGAACKKFCGLEASTTGAYSVENVNDRYGYCYCSSSEKCKSLVTCLGCTTFLLKPAFDPSMAASSQARHRVTAKKAALRAKLDVQASNKKRMSASKPANRRVQLKKASKTKLAQEPPTTTASTTTVAPTTAAPAIAPPTTTAAPVVETTEVSTSHQPEAVEEVGLSLQGKVFAGVSAFSGKSCFFADTSSDIFQDSEEKMAAACRDACGLGEGMHSSHIGEFAAFSVQKASAQDFVCTCSTVDSCTTLVGCTVCTTYLLDSARSDIEEHKKQALQVAALQDKKKAEIKITLPSTTFQSVEVKTPEPLKNIRSRLEVEVKTQEPSKNIRSRPEAKVEVKTPVPLKNIRSRPEAKDVSTKVAPESSKVAKAEHFESSEDEEEAAHKAFFNKVRRVFFGK